MYSETEPDNEVVAKPGQKFEKLNWLKAGIMTADKLLTVSPNYATEIAEDDEKGVELADIIRCPQLLSQGRKTPQLGNAHKRMHWHDHVLPRVVFKPANVQFWVDKLEALKA